MPPSLTEDPTPQGGWHIPEEETSAAPEVTSLPGWKVPTLDAAIPEIPERTGGWHRPRPVDTTLTATDQTVVLMPEEEAKEILPEATPVAAEELPAALSPEEALQMLPLTDGETTAVDAATEMMPAEPLSPEDALSMISLATDEDEEEEAGIRTELLALNMLAADEAAPATDSAVGTPADADDPAEVARRKLAELEAGAPADASYTTYEQPVETAAEPAPLTGEQMRQQELARRFTQAQEDIEQVRALYRQGTITPEQFEAELQNRMILDDDQIWWRMGAEDAVWYKYVGDQWTPAVPPLMQDGRAGLQTERLGPIHDPYNATLPYLSDSVQVEQSAGVGTLPMSVGYSPLPNAVPTEDLDNTMVSPAAFRDSLDTPTIAGATVPIGDRTGSGSLGYGSSPGIQSAVDESTAPDIDYTMPIGTISQEAEQRARTNAARNGVLILVGVVALALIAVATGLIIANNWYTGIVDKFSPQIAALAAYQPEFQTVVIQDFNGREIARLADGGDRVEVPLNNISPFLIHAVIATRNPTFYSDPGWDTGQTVQAWLGGAAVPASPTITQLVARNLVLSRAGSFEDVEELVVAGELVQQYGKDFVLRLFLNEFPFGNATFGAEAASRFYFQKGASELNLPEAALLAAIMENPGGIDPVTNPGIVKPAIENVFARMAQVGCLDLPGRGQMCIGNQDFNTATVIRQKADLELKRYAARTVRTNYPHFVNMVRQQLEAVYGNELYQRGFIVRTTLVSAAQDAAQTMLENRIAELAGTGITTGAIMWTDPATGAIRAYVGSPDYDDAATQGQRDYAREFMQPGGTIMPIVYAAALDGLDRNGNGSVDSGEYLTPASLVWDVPANFPASPSSPPFSPQNVTLGNRFFGPVSVREALANQYAAAAARVYESMGDAAFQQMAERMGLQFAAETVLGLPTSVGETPVRLKDLMTSYATIANGGIRRPVYAIDSITDRGGASVPVAEVIKPTEARAFSPQIAYLLQNILSDDTARNTVAFPRNSDLVLRYAPAGQQPQAFPQNFAGVVAGTNSARTNLWTVGFTTNAVVGVWLGTPDSTVSFSNQTGFTAAAPLWNRVISLFMASIQNNPPRNFPDPGGMNVLSVCTSTGTVFAANQCPGGQARNELFVASRPPAPVELGPIVAVAVNSWTGLRVDGTYCPNPEDAETRVYINTSDPFVVQWLRSAEGRNTATRLGLGTDPQAAPTTACDANTVLPTVNLTSPANGATVQGEIQITGQVNVPANFNRFVLEIAPQGAAQYQPLPGFPQQVQQPAADTILTTFDTRTIPNGNYNLRLAVYGNDGGRVFRTVAIAVNNPTPTATPTPTLMPTAFPTLDLGGGGDGGVIITAIPFDALPTFGATPTPDPF